MKAASVPAMLALALVLTGCGLKGPLYLPEKTGPVTTRPAPKTPAAGSTATPATVPGATPAKPAPETPPETTPPMPPAASDKTGG